MLEYSEIITSNGVRIPFVPRIITPKIERPMRNNRYEGGEAALMRKILQPGDRVLELGGGLGLISTIAALTPGVERVTTIEANPDLLPMIRETHKLNGVDRVELRNGVVSPGGGGPLSFYLRADFWASSMEPDSRPYVREVTVPAAPIGALIAELRPTVIVCDIEGGEQGLFDEADLSGLRCVVLELHEKVYGQEGLDQITALFTKAGFHRGILRAGGSVEVFHRDAAALPEPQPERKPRRAAAPPAPAPSPEPAVAQPAAYLHPRSTAWPPVKPRVFVGTCMKDEGPFILEWVAWQKAIGITDLVVFTNDCSDGTDLLLDRLEALGHLRHLPNPALASGSPAFQPIALAYLPFFREMREADFFISMDVDEMINIRTGKGSLSDLFAAVPQFDVLSMSEINHGSNDEQNYRRGWVKDIFPGHESETPGPRFAHRGVKSIVRLSPRIEKIRNHRPDLLPGPAVWLDGSGRPRRELLDDRGANGMDCRRSFDLVSLDHYPLRSLDSYLVKMFRGDVVVAGKQVSQRYWRLRNSHSQTSSQHKLADAAARKIYDKLLKDKALAELHEASCAAHEARIAELVRHPDFAQRRAELAAQAARG